MTAEMLTDYTCKIKTEVKSTDRVSFLLLSDLHWDNPKTDRVLLKKHLDQAKEKNASILIFGDLFCAMQGKYDPRGSKESVRPEHNVNNYLDALVDTAIEYFTPYKENILFISPGNHECYRADTQVLTKRGWINITDVTLDDEVAVFSRTSIWFECPTNLVSKKVDKMYTIESTNTKQIVSGKHAVVLNDLSKVYAEDVEHLNLTDRDLPNGMMYSSNNSFDPDTVELLTAVVMDATIVDNTKYNKDSIKKRIQFKLSKPRKIEYIKQLLDRCNVSYTVKECKQTGVNKLQPYYIRIYGEDARSIFTKLNGVKQLPFEFSFLTGDSFKALFKALINTDGSTSNNLNYSWRTIDKHNVDVMQAACTLNGKHFKYKLRKNASGFKNSKPQYVCTINNSIIKNRKVTVSSIAQDTTVYCLTIPQGNFITRIEGKVAYSGNTSILKRLETDIIKRLCDGLGVLNGAYTGWVIFNFTRNSFKTNYNLSYHHGYGGGGPVTKDIIQASRKAVYLPDADIVVSGHCFDDKTEILTESGWKKYTELTNDTKVATMNLDSKSMEYQKVNSIHVYDNYKELIHVKAKGVDILTTDKHGMVYLNTAKKIAKCTMSEFINKSEVTVFNSCERYNQTFLDLEDKYLKLVAWIVSDSSYDGNSIRFHFKKQRKIDRVVQLLTEADIKHTVSERGVSGSVKININVEDSVFLKEKLMLDNKNFSDVYYNLNTEQSNIVLNEYRHADGHSTKTHDSFVLYGNSEKNMSVLQSMCVKVGRKATLNYELEKRNVLRLNVSTRGTTLLNKIKHEIVSYEGNVWCVNVDNGTLVVRRNGCVVITQNTHDRWVFPITRTHLNPVTGKQVLREQLHLKLGTYKDEYIVSNGWAIERGMPPKSLGGLWLHFDVHRENDNTIITPKAELA